MTRYAVGLGSNKGDRLSHLRSAVDRLAAIDDRLSLSRLYESEPVGGPDQAPFLNAVAVIETDLDAHGLLDELKAIEKEAGRVRGVRWGPRTLDLDVIASDGPPVTSADLVIPHPRAAEREFVLRPLTDVWADAAVGEGVTAGEAIAAVAGQGVDLVARNWAYGLSGIPGKVFVFIQFAWFLAVGIALAADGTLPSGEATPGRVLGGLLTVLGAGLAFFSMRRLGPSMTAVPEPKEGASLVESGMYRLVRHPIYGGVVLLLVGTSLFLDSVIGSAISVGLLGFFYVKSEYEERRLRIAYPGYRAYRDRVRARLIPFLL